MGEPITEERLERALDYLAYIIKRHGSVYMPIFERLERELFELRRRNRAIEERATRYMAANNIPPLDERLGSEPLNPSRHLGSSVEKLPPAVSNKRKRPI